MHLVHPISCAHMASAAAVNICLLACVCVHCKLQSVGVGVFPGPLLLCHRLAAETWADRFVYHACCSAWLVIGTAR